MPTVTCAASPPWMRKLSENHLRTVELISGPDPMESATEKTVVAALLKKDPVEAAVYMLQRYRQRQLGHAIVVFGALASLFIVVWGIVRCIGLGVGSNDR